LRIVASRPPRGARRNDRRAGRLRALLYLLNPTAGLLEVEDNSSI
jgi:hypothetical protein